MKVMKYYVNTMLNDVHFYGWMNFLFVSFNDFEAHLYYHKAYGERFGGRQKLFQWKSHHWSKIFNIFYAFKSTFYAQLSCSMFWLRASNSKRGAIEFIFLLSLLLRRTKPCLYKLHIEHAIILHTFLVPTRSLWLSDAEVNLAPSQR